MADPLPPEFRVDEDHADPGHLPGIDGGRGGSDHLAVVDGHPDGGGKLLEEEGEVRLRLVPAGGGFEPVDLGQIARRGRADEDAAGSGIARIFAQAGDAILEPGDQVGEDGIDDGLAGLAGAMSGETGGAAGVEMTDAEEGEVPLLKCSGYRASMSEVSQAPE